MKPSILSIVIGLIVLAGFGAQAALTGEKPVESIGKQAGTFTVSKVIDGNTIELSDGRLVRLIGVAIPHATNLSDNARKSTKLGIDEQRFNRYAKKSKDLLEKFLKNRKVVLFNDNIHMTTNYKDRDGRILAYVYGAGKNEEITKFSTTLWTRRYEKLDDKLSHLDVNATMIASGNGFADSSYPCSYQKKFSALQKEAKENKKGMWNPDAFDLFACP